MSEESAQQTSDAFRRMPALSPKRTLENVPCEAFERPQGRVERRPIGGALSGRSDVRAAGKPNNGAAEGSDGPCPQSLAPCQCVSLAPVEILPRWLLDAGPTSDQEIRAENLGRQNEQADHRGSRESLSSGKVHDAVALRGDLDSI